MAVSREEVACLVHSWLMQEGFVQSAKVFMFEAKALLQNISVNGQIRNLVNIMNEYASLKCSQIDNEKLNQHNQRLYQQINDMPPKKRRKLNQNCSNDNDNDNDTESLPLPPTFGLNQEKFEKLLDNQSFHEKIANMIQNKTANDAIDDQLLESILQMDDFPLDDLFIPIPIVKNEKSEEKKKEKGNENDSNAMKIETPQSPANVAKQNANHQAPNEQPNDVQTALENANKKESSDSDENASDFAGCNPTEQRVNEKDNEYVPSDNT